MWMDLLATDNMASYNVKMAKVLGLHSAIYINELINILSKANRKDKMVDGVYIHVDRKYITDRTMLEEEEQLAIDFKLGKVGIISKPVDFPDNIYIDIDTLAEKITSDDEKKLNALAKNAKVKTVGAESIKLTVRQKRTQECKEVIATSNEELRKSYFDWIDTIQSDKNLPTLTPAVVKIFQKDVDKYANRDLDVALKVIEEAIRIKSSRALPCTTILDRELPTVTRKRFEEDRTSGVHREVQLSNEVF